MAKSEVGQRTTGQETGTWRGWTAHLPWKRLALGLCLVVAAPLLVVGLYQAATWPDVASLSSRNPETTAFIERSRARASEAGQPGDVRWHWVPYDRVSPHLKRAVLVAEDISFFSHGGFEFAEIRQAIRDALGGERSLRGASTITQQLAKNLWLSPSRNPFRKVKEAILTRQLERNLSKKRILEIYLNVVEFGPAVYGAEAAARRYFGKPAAELSEEEAAQLAAGLPRPSRWNPQSNSDWYRSYAAKIEQRMDRAEFLWRRI
jgi:monofunctional biosynthetic peptidoglycan transglycosylase